MSDLNARSSKPSVFVIGILAEYHIRMRLFVVCGGKLIVCVGGKPHCAEGKNPPPPPWDHSDPRGSLLKRSLENWGIELEDFLHPSPVCPSCRPKVKVSKRSLPCRSHESKKGPTKKEQKYK